MDMFDAFAGPDLRSLDPSGGVLVVTTYWRPRSEDPNPEQLGTSSIFFAVPGL